ncbi:hypothetical protein CFC21_094619 [Triticum aestivum]|uniref:HMA domain-containing protein n=2 Tax=Triticum aestivum TaxID=4565 RepID=A0A9R1LNI4_WHEAT|nr:hypothetical protein CFC21_094617 [Triticum aestivum]KAF7092104.1 hypothetical protein CFC21_094619 [Triticum aestivum]
MERNQSMGHAGRASGEKAIARELVLKVSMHCRCDGCTPKVSSALNNLALAPGVVAVLERSATEDTEEVRLLATADPERLRKSLHEATGKKEVDLVFIPPKPNKQERSGRWSGGKEDPRLVDFAAVQGLLADPQLHDQAPPPGYPRYGSTYVEGYPPPVPPYYPGPPPPAAWVPYGHPFPAAAAPPGPYVPSAPWWTGGPSN